MRGGGGRRERRRGTIFVLLDDVSGAWWQLVSQSSDCRDAPGEWEGGEG